MTATERLSEAEGAYHSLMTGQLPSVVVDQNGERVEYNRANASRLAMYIAQLKAETAPVRVTGPMRPFF